MDTAEPRPLDHELDRLALETLTSKTMSDGPRKISGLRRLDAGDGVVLRPVRLYHGEEIYAAVMDDRDSLARWLPWVEGVRGLPDVREFIRRSMDEQDRGIAVQLGAWTNATFLGMVGLHGVDWANRRTSIGYWLAEGARGRGVMTACARALVGYAIDDLGLNRVEIRCGADNVASRAVAERLGFQLEGTARQDMLLSGRYVDLVIYAVLACEWRRG